MPIVLFYMVYVKRVVEKMIKRWMKRGLMSIVATMVLLGCQKPVVQEDSIQIVTTIYPIYDWVNQILGENPGNIQVKLLMDNGVDLHSYQPSADDIVQITTCDLFLYVGGESEEWVEDATRDPINKQQSLIKLLDVLGSQAKIEEHQEGMEEEEHDHEHEHEEEHDHEHEEEYDEHIWLSLKNAMLLVESIEQQIEQLDGANAEVYRNNADAYIASLKELDTQYQEVVDQATFNTLVFADRYPFRYLLDDYGLNYYAAFAGCSAETAASFQTITFLAQKVDELQLHSVIKIEGSKTKLAETVIENTEKKNQQILVMDSIQSVSEQRIQEGVSYLRIMEDNLEVLKQALE